MPDATGEASKLTPSRWQAYTRRSKEYEGWGSSLQAEFGHEVVRFLEESSLLDEEVATRGRRAATCSAADDPRSHSRRRCSRTTRRG